MISWSQDIRCEIEHDDDVLTILEKVNKSLMYYFGAYEQVKFVAIETDPEKPTLTLRPIKIGTREWGWCNQGLSLEKPLPNRDFTVEEKRKLDID